MTTERASTTVRVEFVAVGDEFDPADITKGLGIFPDECWRKGDVIHDWAIPKPDTAWCIVTGDEESLDVSVQVDAVLKRIESRKETLLCLRKRLKIEFLFLAVVKVSDGQTPALCFNTRFIHFMNDIGAELHIDLYCD